MKALVYLRVSTEEQAQKGYSIQAQRYEGVSKAKELGCKDGDIYIFSDEGVSGAVLERPKLMEALDLLRIGDNDIKYFICYDSSRLSRNASHQLIIIDEIKKNRVKLIFIKNSYEDNAEGRFQLTVMAAVDEYERARLRLRTEMGKRAKALQHKLTHNPGLYGYDFDPISDTLSINEEQAENLKHMFKMLINGQLGPSEIARKLNESGVPSPRLKQWSRVTVRRILSNPSYLGILYIRRYDTREYHLNKFKSKEDKVKVREKPESEWIPVEIPSIIDQETWEKATSCLKKIKHSKKRESVDDFILTPVLKCGVCGGTMTGKRIIKGSTCYRYYICSQKYKEGSVKNCNTGLVRANEIESTIWRFICKNIKEYLKNEKNADKIIEKFMSYNTLYKKNIIGKKEKAKKEKDRIITLFQKGYLNEAEAEAKLEELEARLKDIDTELLAKYEGEAVPIKKLKSIMQNKKLPYIIENIIKNIDEKSKRDIIELLAYDIAVNTDIITIKPKL